MRRAKERRSEAKKERCEERRSDAKSEAETRERRSEAKSAEVQRSETNRILRTINLILSNSYSFVLILFFRRNTLFELLIFRTNLIPLNSYLLLFASSSHRSFASVALPLRGSHRCVPQASEGVKHRCDPRSGSEGAKSSERRAKERRLCRPVCEGAKERRSKFFRTIHIL
uniref:Uncharacterized protein n=1 Tax=Pseudopediastrum integrum TaxID=271402 RepID=A0A2U8GJX5_9CHLO|nr:hypothetical protein [Pseudopediastrum integrum]YP_009492203.1 hypothetical protein [Pseudopediastrum integrum]AWI68808.1 hypothetical protein [Pseudopediastrum integrum]AWI68809.1 hypothetical protein [Pseudopediastrum integrum]